MSGSSSSHPRRRALAAEDLVDGKRIILFNVREGVLGEFVVKGGVITRGRGWAIELVPVDGGESMYRYLYDLGVEPNRDGFHRTNFTVAASGS